jgi:predicted nuclease of predicted toxin-antitoxin system
MKIELFLDEDVHSGLAHALRKRGYDAIHAQELDRKGRSDSDQLLFAIRQERCLFTFNVKDFVILHNQHAKSQQEHWGIIVSKQLLSVLCAFACPVQFLPCSTPLFLLFNWGTQ